ncbi:hypothetical protein BFZC1_06008 [Lysinibacillus fusiformis ZC1]|nr:hypothetical protein BFZC1_06008 [Lysinibacillus fusiformis ZC1]
MGNEVQTLSTDINVITAEINAYQRVAGEAIFEIGIRLKKVRDEKLAETKGGWNTWCEGDLGITRNHATRFIKVAERFGSVSPGIQNVGLTILSLLAPFDDDELVKPREMPDGTEKTLLDMSRREIEEFKRKEKELIADKEKAELKRKDAIIAEKERSEEILTRQNKRLTDELGQNGITQIAESSEMEKSCP